MPKPTIANRIRELLLEAGPMSPSQLSDHIVAEGLTKSKNPVSVVEQRVNSERDLLVLPDGRIDVLARRLDGVVQTYRVTPHARLVGEICTDDLALLRAAQSLRWFGSATLGWWGDWIVLDDVERVPAGEVLGFRVRGGSVSVEPVTAEQLTESAERESIVVEELRRAESRRALSHGRYYTPPVTSTDPTSALLSLLGYDAQFFNEPMAPVTDLILRAGLPHKPPAPPMEPDYYYDDYSPRPYAAAGPNHLRLIGRDYDPWSAG